MSKEYRQPRYRVIYYTREHDFAHSWTDTNKGTDAHRIMRALAKVPNVTYVYVYDGEKHARIYSRGQNPAIVAALEVN